MTRAIALITEDNPDNIEMYSIMMHIERYTPVGVQDGREALKWLSENDAPAVIILDVNMPKVDGRQVYEHVRGDAKFALTTIIIVTANSYMANVMQTLLHKRDFLLQKPFMMVDLQKIVRTIRKSAENI